jgi:hypothetical protein
MTGLDLHFGRDADVTYGFHLEFLPGLKIRAERSAHGEMITGEPLGSVCGKR